MAETEKRRAIHNNTQLMSRKLAIMDELISSEAVLVKNHSP